MTTAPVLIVKRPELRAKVRAREFWRFSASDGSKYATQSTLIAGAALRAFEKQLRVEIDYYGGWYYRDCWNIKIVGATAKADPAIMGTWDDPEMWPHAIAYLNRMTIGKFALDHLNETATLIDAASKEIHGTGTWLGVTAEVEPLTSVDDPKQMAGLMLRLMSQPFNTKFAYRIVA